MSRLAYIAGLISRLFIVWVIAASLIALWQPATFQFVLPYIKPCLGLIMFGMGMTLETADLVRILKRPAQLAIGVVLQYSLMPLLAFALAMLFRLPPELAVGFIVLGCCPGGTASNVICYLARADVALSVGMTTLSTMLATLLTPTLTLLLASQWMDISFWALFESVLTIVLIPLSLGVLVHALLPKFTKVSIEILPILSVLVITLLVGGIVGKSAGQILSLAPLVLLAVILHNGLGLLLGYQTAALAHFNAGARRAVSIEVGMQNSGLAAALALAHFSPEAALPAALFSVWHNISGPLLASLWRRGA